MAGVWQKLFIRLMCLTFTILPFDYELFILNFPLSLVFLLFFFIYTLYNNVQCYMNISFPKNRIGQLVLLTRYNIMNRKHIYLPLSSVHLPSPMLNLHLWTTISEPSVLESPSSFLFNNLCTKFAFSTWCSPKIITLVK